jgi:chromosome partitioning protein
VLDTPAGLHGRRLGDVLKLADRIIVPLQPSVFDIFATRAFLDQLAEHRHAAGVQVGIVGMRVDARTKAAEQLHHFVDSLGFPVLGYLRDTQNYVHLAAHGLTLFDVAPARVARDLEQWQGICAGWTPESRQAARGVAVTRLTGAGRVAAHHCPHENLPLLL